MDALLDGFKDNSSPVEIKHTLTVRGAADALNLKHATWRCGRRIIKHEELDLVLKSCDRLAVGPQIHTAANAKMAKNKEPWMRLMHNSVETLWLNTHLL